MSSNLQLAVEALLLENYISLIGTVIVGYDYILMLPREIDYVFCRRWTWVSTVFIVVRYCGLCWAIATELIGTSFIPGPVNVNVGTSLSILHDIGIMHGHSKGGVLYLVSCWAFPAFLCAADYVMILRVYSMWNRSRRILHVLLFVYVLQTIISVILPAIYNSSATYFTASMAQILKFSFCSDTFSAIPAHLAIYCALPRFAVSAILLVLAVTRTVGELVEMYNATKQWQPNRYITKLMKDGVYYFLMNTLFNVLQVANGPPIVTAVLGVLSTSFLCSTMPRFIISVRELYDRDLRDRWQGIDSGFGILSQAAPSENEDVSAIALGDVSQGENQAVQGDRDGAGEIQLEVVGKGSHQV